jgi:hypothetical protein
MDFRHYIIKVKPYGVSTRVRKVLEAAAHTSGPKNFTAFEALAEQLNGTSSGSTATPYSTSANPASCSSMAAVLQFCF